MNLMNQSKSSFLTFALLLCSISAGAFPVVAQPADTPTALIKNLYKVHNQGRGPIFEGKSRTHLQKFFDRKLADLLWKVLTDKSEEAGPLDFDPLFNTQDLMLTNFQIGTPTGDDKKSVVKVTFRNAGQPETIKFLLRHTDAGWRVENIVYSDGSDLMKTLSSPQ